MEAIYFSDLGVLFLENGVQCLGGINVIQFQLSLKYFWGIITDVNKLWQANISYIGIYAQALL